MEKIAMIKRLQMLYKENVNIIEYLKQLDGTKKNSIEDIMISYDLQAGSYIKNYLNNPTHADKYTNAIADVINSLNCPKNSIFECGVGEATTLVPLSKKIKGKFSFVGGNDISWSRIAAGKQFAAENDASVELVVADMFDLPLADDSVDIVYTSHSLEPNGGAEETLLKELYRVAREYLILLEPAYDLASKEAKLRMEKHGYVTKLYETAKSLNYKVETYRLFDVIGNPLNPTGLMIIKKGEESSGGSGWCCPITKSPLTRFGDVYYSSEALLAYPVMNGVPVLLRDSAVVATKMNDLAM